MKRKTKIDEVVEQAINRTTNIKAPKTEVRFLSSGCVLLNCVLGGGYAVGRIINIVGDKSTNKTGLAIEAAANFALQYPNSKIYYVEAEAAFDKLYAIKIGLPKSTNFITLANNTVESLYDDLIEKTKVVKEDPTLYILDSLDALSDAAELDREFDSGTYGTKAKKLSELLRRLISKLANSNIIFIITSQERDKINVTFGKKTTRSGGRALDFYASQIIWLAEIKKIKKTINSIERTTGIWVRAKCEKNKVGDPFRDCDFPVIFRYGIEDIEACLRFLNKVGKLNKFDSSITPKNIIKNTTIIKQNLTEKNRLFKFTKNVWYEIESKFEPTESKYGD
jgi:recombination protein RecA